MSVIFVYDRNQCFSSATCSTSRMLPSPRSMNDSIDCRVSQSSPDPCRWSTAICHSGRMFTRLQKYSTRHIRHVASTFGHVSSSSFSTQQTGIPCP